MDSRCTIPSKQFLESFSYLSGQEVATAYFGPIVGLAIASQLLVASQLNCCNMLIFGLHLQSIQEL